MKKILFFAFVAMLTFQTMNAQRKEGNKRTPEQMVERLDKKLNLTDEQETKITALYKDFFGKEYSREERRTKMQELDSKINEILTAEQQALYKEMKSQRKKK